MSETTSPSVHLHPISPSSSLSSTDSAPHSEPTSDEQPDLGAFTTVLREWTHLQPPPRIPMQIRSATSSTTPTFQPSIAGSVQSPSVRSRNSRISNRSIQSSFTRPPSSSAQPEEGSTVWAQGPIASYLLSSTPSNDYDDGYELDGGESEYTPSPPNSLESTSLTVEISSEIDIDFPSLDNDSIGRVDSSPYPYPIHSGVSPVPIPLQDESQRLDSRETAHPDEEIEIGIVEETSSGIGSTFRDQSITITTSSPQSHSRNVSQAESHLTSMQLQSQARPPPTTNASSLSLVSSGVDIIPSVSTISTTSSSQDHYSNTANSQSTTMSNIMNAIINRSRNPMPPRTTSDSSYTASESVSSNVSLVSYQVPETPPISLDEDSDNPTPSFPRSQISALSSSMSLKTQRSVPTSSSGSTSNASLATQRPNQPSSRTLHPSMGSSEYSTGSPLPNPHSPLPTPDSQLTQLFETNHNGWRATATRNQEIINDLGTPDQPPSETLIFDPPRERRGRAEFRPIIDDDDEDIIAARQPATVLTYSTLAGNVPTDATNSNKPHASRSHTSSYDGPGPSNISILGSTYSQPEHQTRLAHNSTMEPHNEDEEDEDDLSEEGYSSRYPYSHGVTPRFHGPALTPKGLPPPVESQTQTQTQTTTTFTSQLDPFSQPFLNNQLRHQRHDKL